MDAIRREFESLLVEGLSARAASRAVGVSPSTGIAWAKAWKDKNSGTSSDGPIGADEERLANLLLAKSEALLASIVGLEHADSRYKQAKAIEALLGKYLALTGKASEQHVVVEGQADLDKLLAQLLPTGEAVGASSPGQ